VAAFLFFFFLVIITMIQIYRDLIAICNDIVVANAFFNHVLIRLGAVFSTPTHM
jgi:hypothetical protein